MVTDNRSIPFINSAREIIKYYKGPGEYCTDTEGNIVERDILYELAPLDPDTGKTRWDPRPKDPSLKLTEETKEKIHYRNLTPDKP